MAKQNVKIIDEPTLVIEQDDLYNGIKNRGFAKEKSKYEYTQACPCRWPVNYK